MRPSFSYYTVRFDLYLTLRRLRHDIRNNQAALQALDAKGALADSLRAKGALEALLAKSAVCYRQTLTVHLEALESLEERCASADADPAPATFLPFLRQLQQKLAALVTRTAAADREKLEQECLAICDSLAERTHCGRNPLEGIFYHQFHCRDACHPELHIRIENPPTFEEALAEVVVLLAEAAFAEAFASKSFNSKEGLTAVSFLAATDERDGTGWRLKIHHSKGLQGPLLHKNLETAQRLCQSHGWTLDRLAHRYTAGLTLAIPK